MDSIEDLIAELRFRLNRDHGRLRRRRAFHRVSGIAYSLTLVLAPAVLAVGLVSSETTLGQLILFAIAVVGGLNAAFRPYLYSHRRRSDQNIMGRLYDEFRSGVAKANGDKEALAIVFDKYSFEFSSLYELRGKKLLDAAEQREITGKMREEAEAEGVLLDDGS